MAEEYPPDWTQAVTWPSGTGTGYIAAIVGADKPAKTFSPDTIDVIRTLIAEADAAGEVVSMKIVEFASPDVLDRSLFQDYAKEWLASNHGSRKVLASEYSAGYDWEKSLLYDPSDSTLSPTSVRLEKVEGLSKAPAGDLWCYVSDIQYGRQCSRVVSNPEDKTCIVLDVYYIWTCVYIDTGGGGGSGDDNALQFSLSCDNTATRGENAGCTVHVTGESPEGEVYTASDFQFDWSSNVGASHTGSGSGGNKCSGTAIETVEITASVASESYNESATITVTARSVESLPLLNAGTARYTGAPRARKGDDTYGLYSIPDAPPGSVSRARGSGPWDGWYMTEVTLENSFYSELHVSHDYSASGPGWPLANGTCANAHSLPGSSSYSEVNTACGTVGAWASFGGEVETHEWGHEASYNSCLSSQSATDMLTNLEEATGASWDVAQAIELEWNTWWRDTWLNSGRSQGTIVGPEFYLYANGWSYVAEYPGIETDGGTRSGCKTKEDKMKNLIALFLICLVASGALAQSKKDMHEKDGVWAKPTPQSALNAIMSNEDQFAHIYATAVLQQKFDQWPASELDAFAEKLGRLYLEGTRRQSENARRTLVYATSESDEGRPYTKSKDIFMRIYESVWESDPYMGNSVLRAVFNANGVDYVRDLFHESVKPEKACSTSQRVYDRTGERIDPKTKCPYMHEPWCVAGSVLVDNRMWGTGLVKPLTTDPIPDDILPHCYGQVKVGDKWPLIVY